MDTALVVAVLGGVALLLLARGVIRPLEAWRRLTARGTLMYLPDFRRMAAEGAVHAEDRRVNWTHKGVRIDIRWVAPGGLPLVATVHFPTPPGGGHRGSNIGVLSVSLDGHLDVSEVDSTGRISHAGLRREVETVLAAVLAAPRAPDPAVEWAAREAAERLERLSRLEPAPPAPEPWPPPPPSWTETGPFDQDLLPLVAALRKYLDAPDAYAGLVMPHVLGRGFVQFAADSDRDGRVTLLHAEASNGYQADGTRLTEAEGAQIRSLGWQGDLSGSDNLWCDFPAPVPLDVVGRLIQETFEVFGVPVSAVKADLLR